MVKVYLVLKLWSTPDIIFTNGCSRHQVMGTEMLLNMSLPEDFIDYAETFGCVSFNGRQWAGIGVGPERSISSITLDEKRINPDFPEKHFILENISDNHKVIVDEYEMVYSYINREKRFISTSLGSYLDELLRNTCIK